MEPLTVAERLERILEAARELKAVAPTRDLTHPELIKALKAKYPSWKLGTEDIEAIKLEITRRINQGDKPFDNKPLDKPLPIQEVITALKSILRFYTRQDIVALLDVLDP